MALLDTVRGSLPREVMAFHDARVSAALAGSGHVDPRHPVQGCHGHLLTHLVAIHRPAELANETLGLTARFRGGSDAGGRSPLRTLTSDVRDMTAFGTRGLTGTRAIAFGAFLVEIA
jgi:hypothetical protein